MHSSSSEQTTTAKLSINFLLNQGDNPFVPPWSKSPKASSTLFSTLSTAIRERSPTRKRKWKDEQTDSFSPSTPHMDSILPPAPKNYQTLFSRRTTISNTTTTTTTSNPSTSFTRKKRPKYRRYPQETLDKLLEAFNSNSRPSEEDQAALGGQLGLYPYQVKIW